jgi:hypothetical protein
MRAGKIVSIFLAVGLSALPAFSETTSKPRILGLEAVDDGSGSSGTVSIDVIQGTCGTGTGATAEPFFDTLLKIKVFNGSNAEVLFNRFTYSINNFDGAGSKLNAVPLALVGTGRVPKGKDGTILVALFINAQGGRKRFTRSAVPIPSDLGFRNVTVTLQGRNARNQRIKVSARTALSFSNFDRCTQ